MASMQPYICMYYISLGVNFCQLTRMTLCMMMIIQAVLEARMKNEQQGLEGVAGILASIEETTPIGQLLCVKLNCTFEVMTLFISMFLSLPYLLQCWLVMQMSWPHPLQTTWNRDHTTIA